MIERGNSTWRNMAKITYALLQNNILSSSMVTFLYIIEALNLSFVSYTYFVKNATIGSRIVEEVDNSLEAQFILSYEPH